jgi:hypothetical protein
MSLRGFRSTTCGAALLLLTAWTGSAVAQSCSSPSDTLIGCIGGFEPGTCSAICSYGLHSTPNTMGIWMVEDNFIAKYQAANALALVQAGDKINKFQANARKVLTNKGIQYRNVATVQQAIAAADSLYNSSGGPIHLLIIGHGREGSIKVGEDRFNHDTPEGLAAQAKFEGAMAGKLVNLTLFGCSVAKGEAGQALMSKMAANLGGIEIKAWTAPVAADENDFWTMLDTKKKMNVSTPAADARVIALVALALLVTGSLFVARSRGTRGEGA